MGEPKVWITLWKTIEDKPKAVFRRALNRFVPPGAREDSCGFPFRTHLRVFRGHHRTYSPFAAPSTSVRAQTDQQHVDNLWICRDELWRKGALIAVSCGPEDLKP
ncbi:hypothetical protein GCM10009813_36310 [Brevibacterium marinum]